MMRNYWIYILALLTIGISSCSVNEELVMLDEVDDIYTRPDEDRYYVTASASTNDNEFIPESMTNASDAELSYYQNKPYSAEDENAAQSQTASGNPENEEYYDYFDEDYAGRLQNFHGQDDNTFYPNGANSMYNNRNLPPTAYWPRTNWSLNYGFNSFGYGTRTGFGMGMGFGNSMMCNNFYDPFYDPWMDPFYSPYCDPFMNPYYNPGWNTGWGMGMNYGWGWNNMGYNPWMYDPYWYGYGQGFADGSVYNSYNYNEQPTSQRRSRGGIITGGNSGSDTGNSGSGIVAGNDNESREATRRADSRVNRSGEVERNPRTERNVNRGAVTRTDRSSYNRRSNESPSRYVRPERYNSPNDYSRTRVAPNTRERVIRSSSPTRSNSLYNNSSRPRMRGNNSYYGSPSRSGSSRPSYSSPSRSRSTSSPSSTGGSRRR